MFSSYNSNCSKENAPLLIKTEIMKLRERSFIISRRKISPKPKIFNRYSHTHDIDVLYHQRKKHKPDALFRRVRQWYAMIGTCRAASPICQKIGSTAPHPASQPDGVHNSAAPARWSAVRRLCRCRRRISLQRDLLRRRVPAAELRSTSV